MGRIITMALAVLACAAAGAQAQTQIATSTRPTEVRAFAGVAVFSLYDGGGYRLAITRGTAAPQLLDVAPRLVPFDADIGPGPDGRPLIVYSRCTRDARRGRRSSGCAIHSLRLDGGRERRMAVPGSASQPTIWRDRIAWVRQYASRPTRSYIYTRAIDAPAGTRSQVLPGTPTRRCTDGSERICSAPSETGEPELELWGRRLAMIVRYDYRSAGGICGTWDVRLDDLRAGTQRLLATQLCGLNGQQYAGVSFASGRLSYARFCAAAPDCGARFGAYRYRIRNAGFELATIGHRLTGYAYVGGTSAYEVRADDTDDGYCGNSLSATSPACELVRVDDLAFGSADAPR